MSSEKHVRLFIRKQVQDGRASYRILSKDKSRQLEDALDAMYLGPLPDDFDYDQALREARDEKYRDYL